MRVMVLLFGRGDGGLVIRHDVVTSLPLLRPAAERAVAVLERSARVLLRGDDAAPAERNVAREEAARGAQAFLAAQRLHSAPIVYATGDPDAPALLIRGGTVAVARDRGTQRLLADGAALRALAALHCEPLAASALRVSERLCAEADGLQTMVMR